MKKFIFFLLFAFGVNVATFAQEDKTKVKKTSTAGQKVHNTFSKHKKYKGYKAKHKNNGHTTKAKADLKKDDVKVKSD